jgi:mannose-1-phosphate guanylyltransferase
MKAFLLAAGLGARLRPLTDQIPKCLVPINGKPLLQIWLDLLGRHGVKEVLVNTHHLPERVIQFTSSLSSRKPKLWLTYEASLLGSAGTLAENWDFIKDEESFLVCYADNLTDINLEHLIQFHESHHGVLTMALFHSEKPTECGIAQLDNGRQILSFEEKPTHPKSSLANAGIYIMRRTIRSRITNKRPADIGFDLLPACLGDTFGWLCEGTLIDIGTPQAYASAQDIWQKSSAAASSKHSAVRFSNPIK